MARSVTGSRKNSNLSVHLVQSTFCFLYINFSPSPPPPPFLSALTGILFPARPETAYSAIRIWQALGFTISFASAEVASTKTYLLMLLVTVVIAATLNLVLELKTQTKQQLLPCGAQVKVSSFADVSLHSELPTAYNGSTTPETNWSTGERQPSINDSPSYMIADNPLYTLDADQSDRDSLFGAYGGRSTDANQSLGLTTDNGTPV